MSLNTRDEKGYPPEGIDVVPKRPKVNKLSQLMKLLQEVNQGEQQANERADYWHRAYQRLNQDSIALQFKDLCSECKQVKDGTDPGETYTLCATCSREMDTVKTLTRKLELKEKEKRYWQECYETLLGEHYDGRGDDGSYQRI